MARRRDDQVFQLSLTEIAFTIAFLMLLLLGYALVREERGREQAEAALAAARRDTDAADARRELDTALKAAGLEANDKTISALVEASRLREERDRLKRRADDLDARLTALVELRRQIAAATPASAPETLRREVESALALQGRVREVFDSDTGPPELGAPPAASAPLVERVVRALRATSGADAENADLRGQVAFLRKELGGRGGRDFPPCWADDGGHVEFLFGVALTPAGITLAPAWPARREAAAHALPGLDAAVGGPWSNEEFVRRTRPLLADSQGRSPECRYYVTLRSTVADAVQSDRERLAVEGVFYKVEERR